MAETKNIVLAGNPNSGKTTLFNLLTGLNQKVGNFPGVTVERKSGHFEIGTQKIQITDLPGAYSLSSKSLDERVVQTELLNPENVKKIDLVLLVIDASNLKRNLFLATQIIDLKIPCIAVLNMSDVAMKNGITIDTAQLQSELGVDVLEISAKKTTGIEELKGKLGNIEFSNGATSLNVKKIGGEALKEFMSLTKSDNAYRAFKRLNNHKNLEDSELKDKTSKIIASHSYSTSGSELHEINDRYARIDQIMAQCQSKKTSKKQSSNLDQITTHPFWGGLIFLGVFFVLFQAVFTLSAYPSDLIDEGMGNLADWAASVLPEGLFNSFISEGIIAGIGGIVVFIPQIAILFGLITVLEDSGYLSRVSFLSDRFLRVFGMNGKSVIPLVGGFACAIPAIMAARSIENKKERLITIFITPLMSCSARLPVYTLLISIVVPEKYFFGFLGYQGLFMMGLYLVGIIFSLIIALIINYFVSKKEEPSSFILEMPNYKSPSLRNVGQSMYNKSKTFLFEAGKVIMIASIALWVLCSFGPSEDFSRINEFYDAQITSHPSQVETLEIERSSELLEHSYMGYVGKTIEPVLSPLGYDWKIGIAVLTSFAAREVFVGTMKTIYAIQGDGDADIIAASSFTIPVALSLLVFYIFAMQCMSTVAIVYQETKSWKLVIQQFLLFTGIAYFGALITFQVFS